MSVTTEQEETLVEIQPHFLSFWPYYLYFIWYLGFSSAFLWKMSEIMTWLDTTFLSFFGNTGVTVGFLLLWWLAMIIPALLFSILQIKWGWVFTFVILATIGTVLLNYFQSITKEIILYGTVGLGVLGLILSDLYRKSHKYILTTFRIITKMGFLRTSTRSLPYSKITDVVTEHGWLGGLFNFGHIFPLTASRMGTGSKTAEVQVGTGVEGKKEGMGAGVGIAVEGDKTVVVPEARSYYMLYGIPEPEEIKKIILSKMQKKEPTYATNKQTQVLAQKLDKILEKLDQISKKL